MMLRCAHRVHRRRNRGTLGCTRKRIPKFQTEELLRTNRTALCAGRPTEFPFDWASERTGPTVSPEPLPNGGQATVRRAASLEVHGQVLIADVPDFVHGQIPCVRSG